MVNAKNRMSAFLGAACTTLLLAALLFIKGFNRVGCPQFWAEDGNIFFVELLRSGWHSVLVVYAGYLHVGTRLCAACAMAFPAINAPTVFFYAAFLVQLTAMVVIARCGTFRSHALGLVAASVLAFQPFDGNAEVFFNLTDLHWFLSLLIPIFLLGPECRFGTVSFWIRLFVHSLAAITNPYTIFFAPVHLIRTVLRRRNPAEIVYFMAVSVFCGIQATVLAFNLTSTAPVEMSSSEVARGYVAYLARLGIGWILPPPVFRAVLNLLTFKQGCSWIGVAGLAYWATATLLTIYGIILIGVRKVVSGIWVLALCGGAAAVAGLGRGPIAYCSDRYFYVPYVLLVLSLLKLVDLDNVAHRAKVILGIVIGMYFISTIPCFVLTELEDLHWREEYSMALKDRSHLIKLHPVRNLRWHLVLPQQIPDWAK